jgi:hypothetical protein
LWVGKESHAARGSAVRPDKRPGSAQVPPSTACHNTPKKRPPCHGCGLQLEALQARYLGGTRNSRVHALLEMLDVSPIAEMEVVDRIPLSLYNMHDCLLTT